MHALWLLLHHRLLLLRLWNLFLLNVHDWMLCQQLLDQLLLMLLMSDIVGVIDCW